jgi:HK97 family phage major capsid protein
MTMTVAVPSTPKEWEEYLNGLDSPEKFSNAMTDGSFKTQLSGYMRAQNSTATDLRAQVDEQVQASVANILRDNGHTAPSNVRRLNMGQKVSAAANPHAPGAGLNGRYDTAAAYFQNALINPAGFNAEQRTKFDELRNYSSQTGSEGGFLIPEEWRAELFSGPELERAIVRPNATVVPMSSKSLHFPAIEFSTEVGEIWGGMIFYWMDEQATIPDTSAAFAQIEFNANRLAGAAKVPNDTLKDAGALDAWLKSSLPVGIREFEDRAFLKGDGVKKPLGALNAANPSLIVANDEGASQQSGITWLNVLAMASRLLPESWDKSIWVITPDALPEIFSMALPVGTGGSAVMITPGAGSASPTMTLLGRPIRWSRKAPAALGTQGDISLCDFSLYGVGDRQDVRVETSEHAYFFADQTAFKVIERVDGQPLLLNALTPENGGPTLSGFVQLATRTVT